MVPRQMRETCRPVCPRLRYFIDGDDSIVSDADPSPGLIDQLLRHSTARRNQTPNQDHRDAEITESSLCTTNPSILVVARRVGASETRKTTTTETRRARRCLRDLCVSVVRFQGHEEQPWLTP